MDTSVREGCGAFSPLLWVLCVATGWAPCPVMVTIWTLGASGGLKRTGEGDPRLSRSPPHGHPGPNQMSLCALSPRCLMGPFPRVSLETWEWASCSEVEWVDGTETDAPHLPDLQTIEADGTAQRLFL